MGSDEMTSGYLQHSQDWTVTLDAIKRLSARLGEPFSYADLAAEIEEHDGLKIYPLAYGNALDAVAKKLASSAPLWTVMVVNAATGDPGDGFWGADYPDTRYRTAEHLSPEARTAWLTVQQKWCVAAALVEFDPLNRSLREKAQAARERAEGSLIDLMLRDRQNKR